MLVRKTTLPNRKTALRLLAAVNLAIAAAAVMVGCDGDSPPTSTASTEHAGSIGLDLQLAPGFTLDTVSYVITGPAGFARSGVIDVSNSTKISALIASLPVGKGFSITPSANAVQGIGSCSGSASFDIVAKQTTAVTVRVTCHETARSGSALINGQLNVCPVIDGLSATPGEVIVGGSIALGVAAHDSDAGPSALSYHWTASSGSLSSDAVAKPIFKCTSAGTATLNVTVSDGDPTAGCADSSSLTVQCSSATSCAGYDSTTAALGELTADCRGTVDPNDYVLGQDGRLAPRFDSCPLDANDPKRPRMIRILQLLSIQHASDLPDVIRCTAGRFEKLKAKFAASGITQCPTWTDKKVQNPITPAVIDKLAPLLPDLGEEDTKITFRGPVVLPPELSALKVKSTYTVTFPQGNDQKCGTAAACAAACAEVFPGFVIPSIPGVPPLPDDTILVDPDTWWDHEIYDPMNPDPNNTNPQFYHQMGYVLPTPGEKYGAVERWNPCNAQLGLGTGLPSDALTVTNHAVTSTDCQSEKCNWWGGGEEDSPSYYKTKMQLWCVEYDKPETCLSYCGSRTPPPAF